MECATKRGKGMRGNRRRPCQVGGEPLGRSAREIQPGVQELPLKGIGEARGKPPRGRAWLRDRMVSANEAGFNLRERSPLPRNILHSLVSRPGCPGQRPHPTVRPCLTDDQGWLWRITSPKGAAGHLTYPATGRDTAKSGMGCWLTATYTVSSSPLP